MNNILLFDSWTLAHPFIERLIPAFEQKGYRLILIHFGSWGHDKRRPREETIGTLLTRDISYYNGKSVLDILKHENPKVVLFLSVQAFAHRAINRYCKVLNIPTVHLYHGINSVYSDITCHGSKINYFNHFRKMISRTYENLIHILPFYVMALLNTKASALDWVWFFRELSKKITARSYAGVAPPDSKTNRAFVFTPADVPHAVNRYNLDSDDVYVVGNLDLVKFGFCTSDLCYKIDHPKNLTNEIIYVDSGLVSTAEIFNDKGEFLEHIQATNDALMRFGFQLVVKLHPGNIQNGVENILQSRGIITCRNENYVETIRRSAGVIAEPTSAALIAAYMGSTMLLARFDKLKDVFFGNVLLAYPKSCYLENLDDLPMILANSYKSVDNKVLIDWINSNIGPLPAEHFPIRVASYIYNIR